MNKKRIVKIAVLSLGTISIIISILNFMFDFLNDYMSSFFLSFGITLVVFSIYRENSKTWQKNELLSETDERVIMINNKVGSTTYAFHIFLFAFLIIVLGFFEKTILISIILAGIIMVEYFVQIIVRKYYNKKY